MKSLNHSEKYLALMGMHPQKVPHWKHWANPDAESYLTGIDYYEHPRLCRIKMGEIYPQLELPIPQTDEPKVRPKLGTDGMYSDADRHTVRWSDGETATWQHGEAFLKSEEEVFAFSPLEKSDFSYWSHVVENMDFS